jgi:hypothetical protein
MLTFELLCATLIALLFGTVICYGGYRLFLVLLPIWGFFFGFAFGAQTVQLLLGEGFLASATSWVVGFIVALLFSVLSYLFYAFAVALIAGSIGYAIGVGMIGLFSAELNLLAWMTGLVVAVVVIGITFRFALAKYIIIVATALAGAGIVLMTLVAGVENVQLLALTQNPVGTIMSTSFIWTLLFVFMAISGIALQIMANRQWELETYNRWEQMQAG